MESYRVKMSLMMILVLAMSFGVSMGKWYKVGDEAGWTNKGHVDYGAWAKSKIFRVGDTVQFVYKKGFYGVLRVSRKNYNSCNATAPYSVSLTGNDTYTIQNPGHFYFICGRIGHCEIGQKVRIRAFANDTVPFFVPIPIHPSPPHHDNPSPAPVPSLIDWHNNSPGPAPEIVKPPSTSPSPSPSPSPFPLKKSGGSALGGGKVLLTSVVLLAFCACGIVY